MFYIGIDKWDSWWDDTALPRHSECGKELENLVAPLLEYAETQADKDAVRFEPASDSENLICATYSTVRAFLANENVWSFLPLSSCTWLRLTTRSTIAQTEITSNLE